MRTIIVFHIMLEHTTDHRPSPHPHPFPYIQPEVQALFAKHSERKWKDLRSKTRM